MKRRHAFSLVELMVTLGVIGLLIGILVPILGGARGSAMEVASLANARSVGQTFAAFNASHRGAYPFPDGVNRQDDNLGYGPIIWTPSGEEEANSVSYRFSLWDFAYLWPASVRSVAPWQEHYPSWLSPGRNNTAEAEGSPLWAVGHPGVSYFYSTAFLLSPAALREGAPANDAFVQRTTTSMVAHPAKKVLAYDNDRAYLRSDLAQDARWPTLFADGSASLTRREQARVANNPLKSPPFYSAPFHDTPDGVAGYDF